MSQQNSQTRSQSISAPRGGITIQHSADIDVYGGSGQYFGLVHRNFRGEVTAVSGKLLPRRADGHTHVACTSVAVGIALLRAAGTAKRVAPESDIREAPEAA